MSPHREPVHEEMMEGRWQKDKEESKVRHKPYSCLCACPSPMEQQEGEGQAHLHRPAPGSPSHNYQRAQALAPYP